VTLPRGISLSKCNVSVFENIGSTSMKYTFGNMIASLSRCVHGHAPAYTHRIDVGRGMEL
jgi:hypothetical protein